MRIGSARRDGASLTPNLDRLGAGRPRFAQVIAPSGWTLPSLATLLTGRDALLHPNGREAAPWMPPASPTVVEIFAYYGYHTAVFYGYNLAYFKQEFSRGFQQVSSQYAELAPTRAGEEVADWIQNRAEEPFVAVVHNVDLQWIGAGSERTGVDRYFAQQQAEVGDAAGAQATIAAYDAGVSEYDTSVGEMLSALSQRHFTRPTVVVFTSPHGIHLSEQGTWFHGTPFEACVRIPLVIDDPRVESRPVEIDAMVQLEDVAPTLLDLAGIVVDGRMTGRSLVPVLSGSGGYVERDAFIDNFPTNIAIRTPTYKVSRFQGGAQVRFTDLVADPMESDAGAAPGGEARALEVRLAAWLAARDQEVSGVADQPDPTMGALKKALKDRGYWPGVAGGE